MRSILGIDTSGNDCSVSVWQEGQSPVSLTQTIGQGHAAVLPPMVDDVLGKAGISPSELSVILVTVGPGSFTGIRVGLAFAKGFASPLSAQLHGLTSFEMVYGGAQPSDNQETLIALDTKRGDYYTQWVRQGAFETPQILEGDTVREIIEAGHALVIGDGLISPTYSPHSKGADALINAYLAGYHRTSDPFYLRPPDVSL